VDKDSAQLEVNIQVTFGTKLKYSWEIMHVNFFFDIDTKMADQHPFCFQVLC